MGSRPGERVGIIYGEVEAASFKFAASDPDIKRLDYVSAQHPSGIALGLILDVQRHSQLSFQEAVTLGRGGPLVSGDQVSCKVKVIGYRDERGLLQVPRTPFKAGSEVRKASPETIQRILGLGQAIDEGAYLGFLKGTEIPVLLDVDVMVQKHVSVLAKTGAGKSYTVGVLIEELLKKKVPLVIIDPHGEYGTLANPNIEPKEIDSLIRFALKPKSFAGQLAEYALDTRLVVGARRLGLDGTKLESQEIMDLLQGKVSSAQQGLLYQAINELRRSKPLYTLKDIGEQLARNPSNAKWPLIAALENLEATGLFSPTGTPVQELVKAAHASILNLKGASPPLQEIVVARLCRSLFEARKRNLVPAFLMVVEEAHNFCPERGIAQALSGPELRIIASEGRKFGFGLLIVSQRPAKVDKNVLSQCNTQIIMKVTNPNDLRAIGASVEGLTSETADEIQRLSTGVALVAGGLLATPILAEIRTRQTRHGGKSVSVMVDEEEDLGAPASPAAMETEPLHEAALTQGPQATDEGYVHVEPAPTAPVTPAFEGRDGPPSVAPEDIPATSMEDLTHRVEEVLAEETEHRAEPKGPWSSEGRPAPPPAHPPPPEEPPEMPKHRTGLFGWLRRSKHPFEPGPQTPQPKPAPPTPRAMARVLPEPEHQVGPAFEAEELLLARVLERVANVTVRSPREATARVKDLARHSPSLSPEEYVRAFARVGRAYCYPSNPECGPCPLLRQCRLGLQRLARGEVQEGRWGRRAK